MAVESSDNRRGVLGPAALLLFILGLLLGIPAPSVQDGGVPGVTRPAGAGAASGGTSLGGGVAGGDFRRPYLEFRRGETGECEAPSRDTPPGVIDLRPVSWGDGSKVPTSNEKSLIIVGTDDGGRLHIRIFDAAGNRKDADEKDTDETRLPAQAAAIKALRERLPGLMNRVLTGAEKAQVIAEVTSIVDPIPTREDNRNPGRDAAEAVLAIHRGDSNPDSFVQSKTWVGLREASIACLALLEVAWPTISSPAEGYAEPGAKPTGTPGAKPTGTGGGSTGAPLEDVRSWFHSVEDLLALVIVCRVSHVTASLKTLIVYLAAAPLLLWLAVSSYPFQPRRFLLVSLSGLLLAVVGGVVWVLIRMERNELLSRVSKSTPNAVAFDREFVTAVLAFVVPLIGLALAQFPSVSDMLSQWLEPLERVLR